MRYRGSGQFVVTCLMVICFLFGFPAYLALADVTITATVNGTCGNGILEGECNALKKALSNAN